MQIIKILVKLTPEHIGTVLVFAIPLRTNINELLKIITVLISYTLKYNLQSDALLLMSQIIDTICSLYSCSLINAHDYTDTTETFTGIIKANYTDKGESDEN